MMVEETRLKNHFYRGHIHLFLIKECQSKETQRFQLLELHYFARDDMLPHHCRGNRNFIINFLFVLRDFTWIIVFAHAQLNDYA